MMDFANIDKLGKQLAFDDGALEEAEHGDTERLALKVRKGYKLTVKERRFVADFLEGKRKFKRGKASVPFYLDAYVLEAYVYRTQFLGDKAGIAKEEIAKQIGETVKNVHNRIHRAEKSQNHGAETHSEIMKFRVALWKSLPKQCAEDFGEPRPGLDGYSMEQIEILKKLPMKKMYQKQ